MAAILRPIVLLLLFALSACTALQQRKPEGVSFLAFGDSGYHYDYLKKKVRQNPLTVEGYLAARRKKWIGKQLPQEEFEAPPIHIVPGTRQAVEASGARPVAEAMYSFCARDDCQFALMLGDNIYPAGATGTGDEIRFRKILEEPYRKLVESRAGFRLYAVLGNHDWKTSRAGRQRQIEYGERSDTAFTLESPGYYSFVRGDVEFFAIDTNLLLAGTRVKKGELNPDGSEKESGEPDVPKRWELPGGGDRRQLRWLEQALKHSRAGWKVVFGHHPLWSAGGGKFEQARSLRRLIGPLICRYADIYLAGHEHDLELNLDSCRAETGTDAFPLPLVVSGAGSRQRPVHRAFQSFQESAYPQFRALWSRGMTWGFSHLSIDGDRLTVEMITTPDSGTGEPVSERTFVFHNRSRLLREVRQ